MTDYRDKMDRDHYDRPSWSEIDKKKDRSKHVRDDEREIRTSKKKSVTGLSRYKEDLDRLFKTGEKSGLLKSLLETKGKEEILEDGKVPERQKLLRSIREAIGEKEINENIDKFLEKFQELPDDIEILTQALLHRNPEIQEFALQKISKYLDGHLPQQKSLLLSRIKNLINSTEEDSVRSLAVVVRKKLGL